MRVARQYQHSGGFAPACFTSHSAGFSSSPKYGEKFGVRSGALSLQRRLGLAADRPKPYPGIFGPAETVVQEFEDYLTDSNVANAGHREVEINIPSTSPCIISCCNDKNPAHWVSNMTDGEVWRCSSVPMGCIHGAVE